MKNVKIVLILLFICFKVSAQNDIPVQSTWILTDNYGRKYDSKIPKERYKINSNGKIEGLYIFYDEDGKTIKQKINYKNA